MAGAAIEIRIDDTALRSALARLVALGDGDALHSAWDAIGEAMVSSTQRRFREGRAPDGHLWPPSQRALKEGGKTLIDKGRLLASLTHNVLGDGVEWGSNVVYAAIHQFGGVIQRAARAVTIYRRVNKRGELSARFVRRSRSNFASVHQAAAHAIVIPARPYLGVDRDDLDEAESLIGLAIDRVIEGRAP